MEKKEREELIEILNGIDDLRTQAFILVPQLEDFIDEKVSKAGEEGSKDGLIQLLNLLKGIDNTLELQVLILGLERKLKGEDAGLAYDTLIHKLAKLRQ